MKTVIKILVLFLALTGATTLMLNYTDVKLGAIDFFINHGWIFLISIALFPRLTLIVSGLIFHSIEFGGIIWWAGFFLAPRFLVSILATISYWNTNQMLVIASWLIALGGESSEKIMISRRMKTTQAQKFTEYQGTTIDAEYKVKE